MNSCQCNNFAHVLPTRLSSSRIEAIITSKAATIIMPLFLPPSLGSPHMRNRDRHEAQRFRRGLSECSIADRCGIRVGKSNSLFPLHA
ncbi:hypothetical protein RJT34_14680 [Clitoria ternatea]|uniref:Uncharacterized protein n=1 Tax=Clitoria ternatea TaxID=43366 RepID=A0AAN9JQT5_CLITE